MTNFRSIALAAACLAASFVLPALAQTAMPDPAPATAGSAAPQAPHADTGMKTTTPDTHARHKTRHHLHAKAAAPTAPPARAGT